MYFYTCYTENEKVKPGKDIQSGNLTLGHMMKRYTEVQFPMVTAFIVEILSATGYTYYYS